jgi:hypothetical protein
MWVILGVPELFEDVLEMWIWVAMWVGFDAQIRGV